jgi:predicted glycoside hydrolase/deacetylase ChbG (UPF0249 family)
MIVCADDYGLAPDIDHAIRELADGGRLSAVSCLVTTPAAEKGLPALAAAAAGRFDLGLHLDLVEGTPLSAPGTIHTLTNRDGRFAGFRALHAGVWNGTVAPEHASLECEAQLTRFVALAGRPPDFVDGHLHIQQFPVIRDRLIDCLIRRPATERPVYVRNAFQPYHRLLGQRVSFWKSFGIGVYGIQFRRCLMAARLGTNSGFAGFYPFDRPIAYKPLLSRFLNALPEPNGLLMTHPGLTAPWRRAEFEALREADNIPQKINRFQPTNS